MREGGGGRGRIDILYFQHYSEPNCKAAYLFLISLTLKILKVAKELIYFRVTQPFPKDILHIGP